MERHEHIAYRGFVTMLLLLLQWMPISCMHAVLPGGTVYFRAVSRSNDTVTKTSYGGSTENDGKERINWIRNSDVITIACAQCNGETSADYIVSGAVTSSGSTSSADGLTPVGGSGLQWGTANPHIFYGVYPAGTASVTKEGVVSATFPAMQGSTDVTTSSGMSDEGIVVRVMPDMRNAFLYCFNSTAPSMYVDLDFSPLFTAFQFTVGGDGMGGDVALVRAELSSSSCVLSGSFSYNIAENTYIIPERVSGENDKIVYTFPTGTVVNTDKLIQFILFVQPSSGETGNANHSGMSGVITDLTIRFTLGNGDTRALALKYNSGMYSGRYVDFPGGRKINISGLTLPNQVKAWSFVEGSIENLDATMADAVVGSVMVSDLDTSETEYWVYEVQ